jgi:peptidyl-prolyl cis-trans isomerase C
MTAGPAVPINLFCVRHLVNQRLLFVAFLALAVACQKTPAKPAAPAATPQATAAQGQGATALKPVPAQVPAVLARVNGRDIPKAEFEGAIKNVEANAGGPVPADRRDEVYRQVLDQLVAYHLLAQESAARKLTVTDAEVEERLKQIRGQFPDEPTFLKALGAQQMTLDKLRAETRSQLLVNKVIDAEVNTKISVQPKDVSDFYAKNPDKFVQPESLRASHVLIRLPDKSDEAAKTKARAETEAILKRLKGGANFAAVAKEKSQDVGTAQNGGELPVFARGQMVPAFEEAAFALKPGQMSGVVETPFGFHIIKVIERRPAAIVPFADVQAQIAEGLTNEQRQQKIGALIEQLKAKAKIEIFI